MSADRHTVAISALFVLAVITVGALWLAATDDCVEWRQTGGQTCHLVGKIVICNPNRECVRRDGDGK